MSSSTSSQSLVPAPVESSSSSVNVISSSNETSTAPVATPVQSSSSSASSVQGASSNADKPSIGKQNGNGENGTGKGKSQGVLPQTGDQTEGVLAVIAGIVLMGIVGMIVYRKQQ